MKTFAQAVLIALLFVPAASARIQPGPSNEYPWTGAWTNVIPANRTGQTFVTVTPIIRTIDLDLMTGNPGRAASDTLTLTVFEGTNVIGSSSITLSDGADGWQRFTFSPPVRVRRNTTVRIELADSGATMFGWRYISDMYLEGHAVLLGVEDPQYDFRFKVNAP